MSFSSAVLAGMGGAILAQTVDSVSSDSSSLNVSNKNMYPEWDASPVPFYVDVAEADISWWLNPKDRVVHKTPNFPDTTVDVKYADAISGELTISDNKIPLLLRSVLVFEGVSVENLFFHFEPERLSVGDHGAMHLVTRVPSEIFREVKKSDLFHFLTQVVASFLPDSIKNNIYLHDSAAAYRANTGNDWMPPEVYIPLGRDFVGDGQESTFAMEECCDTPLEDGHPEKILECIDEDHEIPQCRPLEFAHPTINPKLDFVANFIPEAFLGDNGRLPAGFELNDLLKRAFVYLAEQEDKPKSDLLKYLKVGKDEKSVESLSDLFESGGVEIDLGKLVDFYWPGFIDLGASAGEFCLYFEKDGVWTSCGKNLDIQIESIEKMPGLSEMRIKSASAYSLTDGVSVDPGISAVFDPKAKQLNLSANLLIETTLELPFLGSTQLNAHLVTQFSLKDYGQEGVSDWQLVPKTNWGHVQIQGPETQDEVSSKLFTFDITDKHKDFSGFKASLVEKAAETPTNDPRLSWSASLALEQEEGRYLWEDFDVASQGRILNNSAEGIAKTNVSLDLSSTDLFQKLAGGDLDDVAIMASYAIDHNAPGDTHDISIKEGLLEFGRYQEDGAPQETLFLEGETGAIEVGAQHFVTSQLALGVNHYFRNDGKIELGISMIEAHLNADESHRPNLLKGSVDVELKNCKGKICKPHLWDSQDTMEAGALGVLYDPDIQIIEVKNLDLVFAASGFDLPPILKERQKVQRLRTRRVGGKPGPKAVAIAADGHLKGHYTFNLSEFTGEGDLRLLGDRQGDVYFTDRRGENIGALYSNSRWRFRRFNQVLLARGFALGTYRLDTTINFSPMREIFGAGATLKQRWTMRHGDIPVTPGGLGEISVDFLGSLAAQTLRETAVQSGMGVLVTEEGRP